MLMHCDYLLCAYSKITLIHATINTNNIICIKTKEFYWATELIVRISQDGMKLGTRMVICGHDITVTPVSHNNKRILMSLY
jgi:hypothetical protein